MYFNVFLVKRLSSVLYLEDCYDQTGRKWRFSVVHVKIGKPLELLMFHKHPRQRLFGAPNPVGLSARPS